MEEFKGDRRTREYKEWKAKFEKEQESKSKGLGDTVAKITKATGIDKVVKAVAGEDCGCEERKDFLNNLVRYKVVNCPTEEEYDYLNTFFSEGSKSRVTSAEQRRLLTVYNRVFSQRQQMSSCPSCVAKIVRDLRVLIENN
jgi:predicted Zn-ribbon and HTH transcriptional regulator